MNDILSADISYFTYSQIFQRFLCNQERKCKIIYIQSLLRNFGIYNKNECICVYMCVFNYKRKREKSALKTLLCIRLPGRT